MTADNLGVFFEQTGANVMSARWTMLGAVMAVALGGASAGPATAAGALSLHSPAFAAGQNVPRRFTCDGAGQSPTLMIQGVPKTAGSLVLEIRDPDAPGGSFLHWGLYNLAPDVAFLAAGAAGHALPGPAATLDNGYGQSGYGAICPPPGQTHRYRFTLYALDTRLSSTPSNARDLKAAMASHIIERTRFTASYTRHD